jgi:hypothetical protein
MTLKRHKFNQHGSGGEHAFGVMDVPNFPRTPCPAYAVCSSTWLRNQGGHNRAEACLSSWAARDRDPAFSVNALLVGLA